jgi:Domain of unknown function (DUF4149)
VECNAVLAPSAFNAGEPGAAYCRGSASVGGTLQALSGYTPPVFLAASLTIRMCLALWVGGTLLVVLAAPVVFAKIPSRDMAGEVFGEILRRFEGVKHALSLALVVAVFVQLERTRGLAGQSVISGVAIFAAVATNVYLAMVVRPRLNYFRMKVGSFDQAPAEDPWRARFDRLHRRSTRVLFLGWVAAAVGLMFGP